MSRRPLMLMILPLPMLIVAFFVTSLISTSSNCSLAVNAQDNPCLAQDATISAQELKIFQLESTITALNSNNSSLSTSQVQSVGDIETFDNNNRRWQLNIDSNPGATRISQGTLLLTAYSNNYSWAPIPDINPESFYVEATALPVLDDLPLVANLLVGFYFGDTEERSHHKFGVFAKDKGSDGVEWYVMLRENNSTIFETPIDQVWDVEDPEPFEIALEGDQGFYSLYLNGSLIESIQIDPHGKQIGFSISSFGTRSKSVAFDDVSIR